jgi:hypothetical protein
MASAQASHSSGGPVAGAPVSLGALWFAILAAPLAWSTQELICYGIASRLCRLKPAGAGMKLAADVSAWFAIVTLITFALAVTGAWVAARNWRRVRDVRRESNINPREINAERSRFMGHAAIICNVGFISAFVFTTAELLVSPLCG